MKDIAYRRAEALIEARLGFYRHAIVFFALNLLLAILNLTQTREDLWFQWPLLGWGIGLLAHGLKVFSSRRRGARKEQIDQREMERQAHQHQEPPSGLSA